MNTRRNQITVIPSSDKRYLIQDFMQLIPGTLIKFRGGSVCVFCSLSDSDTPLFGLLDLTTFQCYEVDTGKTYDFRELDDPVLTYTEVE